MQQILTPLCFVFIYISYVHTQILYECDFDTATLNDNCFTTSTSMTISTMANPTSLVPSAPLSDVTSSLKPTENGEVCKLPYRVGTYNWDMYFCNRGFCPTQNSLNSTCKTGKFVQFLLTTERSYQLKTGSDGINGINEQCLIYYYYMGSVSEKSITVRKEEASGESETIDTVTSSPFNGWIQRQIPFNAAAPGYKINFDLKKISGLSSPTIGLDEISIRQGSCDEQLVTNDPTTSISVHTTTRVIQIESTTTPVSVDITSMAQSSTTTPIIVSPSTSNKITISTPIPDVKTTVISETETTYLDEITTQTAIKSSTTIPIISSVQMESSSPKITIPTTQSSSLPSTTTVISSTTTTTLPAVPTSMESAISTTASVVISSTTAVDISSTTTPIVISNTTTSTVPTTSTTTATITTSTLETSTTTNIENVIISSYDEILPREKNHIIIMATVIPVLWVVFIIALVWIKRSIGVLSRITHPFSNWSAGGESAGAYELGDVSEA